MIPVFSQERYSFEFKKKIFSTFDQNLISKYLGKSGNQSAINSAGSNWKRNIHRNRNKNQPQSNRINPKWSELYELLDRYIEKEIDSKIKSFHVFQEINSKNLQNFKTDYKFRLKVISEILDENNEFRESIPIEYTYIIFVLYISQKYSLFHKFKFRKFTNKIGKGLCEYRQKYFNALQSTRVFENLTALCFNQYFWIDFRLYNSPKSIIHNIIFDIIMSFEQRP